MFHIAVDKAGRIVDKKIRCGDLIPADNWKLDIYDFNSEHCDIRGRTLFEIPNLCKSKINLTYRACYRWRSNVKQCYADIHFNFPETQCGLYKWGDKALT